MLSRDFINDALHFDLGGGLNDGLNTTDDSPFVFTYQFANSQPSDLNSTYSGWTALTGAEKANYRAALDLIEAVANVKFQEVTGSNDPDLNVGKVGFSGSLAGLGGFNYSTRNGELNSYDGFTLFDNDINLANATNLILHEIGHFMTLKHPFDRSPTLPEEFESNKYTVMSYDRNPDNNQDSDGLMLFDILALQDRWGANTETNGGNTTYTGSRTANIDSIWDAGGIDTFDASASDTAVRLDLREGMFSRFGTIDDVSISYDTVIENATGGARADWISGNNSKNVLEGGGGRDKLFGRQGNDDLDGGTGNDILRGGSGRDQLDGGAGRDRLLGGKGRDTLNGGEDNDRLHGGASADRFEFETNGGKDIILDFKDDVDHLFFKRDDVSNSSQALARASDTDGDVVFAFENGDSLIVENISKGALTDDILFA